MRFARYALGAALVLPCIASHASAAIFVADAYASGTTLTRTCAGTLPCPETTTPDQKQVTFSFQLPDTAWTEQKFNYYNPANYSTIIGTVVSLGNGAFTGKNLSFFSDYGTGKNCVGSPSSCTYIETKLSAATFAVYQVFPAPVPEPATWALMILGFGTVGWAMRHRKQGVRARFA